MSNFGMVLFLVGIAVIVYYFIRRRKASKKAKLPRAVLWGSIVLIVGGMALIGSDPQQQAETAKQEKIASSKRVAKSKSESKQKASDKKAAAKSSSIAASSSKKAATASSKAESRAASSSKAAAVKSSSKKAAAASSKAIASSKEVAAKSSSKKATPKKLTKVQKWNNAIASYLKEDQGFAKGTLDENGKPTNNGKPNSAFDWSTQVTKITVDKSKKVTAIANGTFAPLNDDAKKSLAQKVMNAALNGMGEVSTLPDDVYTDGLFTEIKYGGNVAVQSHATNFKEFRVY